MNPEVVVRKLRNTFQNGKTRSVKFRKEQLKKMYDIMKTHKDDFIEALHEDLHKPFGESMLFEVEFLKNDIIETLNNLDEWVKPEHVPKNIVNKLNTCYNVYEPMGVSLIIGAWNFPLQLTLLPLVGAIAAGNCAVVKPSELAPKTAALLESLVSNYLDQDCYVVMQGAVEETTALLKCQFDHIFYTGSTAVGKIVMRAAAENLSRVTLELGGKSPCYVAEDSDLNLVARRVTWGKFSNGGQICIAPDYLLCHPSIQEKLVKEMEKTIKEFFGEEPKASPDFGRIINQRHFNRVKKLLDSSGRVAIGGDSDEGERFIAPTVLVDVTPSDPIMQEEVFGPLLPILNVEDVDEAIDFINCREKPLSLYVFSKNQKTVDKFISKTSSGGLCANDTLIYASVDHLPFGGVGYSGTGSYHGKHSFMEFSHKKPVFVTKQNMESINRIRYPPYTEKKISNVVMVMGKSLKLTGGIWYIPTLVLGVFFSFIMKILGLPRYFLT